MSFVRSQPAPAPDERSFLQEEFVQPRARVQPEPAKPLATVCSPITPQVDARGRNSIARDVPSSSAIQELGTSVLQVPAQLFFPAHQIPPVTETRARNYPAAKPNLPRASSSEETPCGPANPLPELPLSQQKDLDAHRGTLSAYHVPQAKAQLANTL